VRRGLRRSDTIERPTRRRNKRVPLIFPPIHALTSLRVLPALRLFKQATRADIIFLFLVRMGSFPRGRRDRAVHPVWWWDTVDRGE
jgi:hypothetical protein